MATQQSNAYRQHTNSDGITLYGPDSCVQFGFYDLYLSIKMYPIKPENERNERSVYDYTNRINCSISREDILYLAYVIKHLMIPASLKGEGCFRGIKVSKSNTIFCISNGIAETGQLDPYIAIYKNLDKNFRPSERRIFRFGPKKTITVYKPDSSEIQVLEDNISGLFILAEFFNQCTTLCGAEAHMQKYISRFRNNAQFNIMNSIAGKLGIPTHAVNTVDRRGTPDWDNASAAGDNGEYFESLPAPEAAVSDGDNFPSPESLADLKDLI